MGALALSLLLPGCGGDDAPSSSAPEITVAVAASMADVVGEAVAAWEAMWRDERSGFAAPTVRLMTGSSATLARQIEQGAPVDLFVSASVEWMDQLRAAGRLVPGLSGVLAGNRLVWARPVGERAGVPADGAASRDGAPGATDAPASLHAGALPPAVAALLSDSDARWTTGDPTHVPLGRYGKQALDAAGAWPALAPRLVPAPDARAALRLVERGEVAVGLLYASDALGNDAVAVVAEVPAGTHDPIVYPVALVQPSDPLSPELLLWLTSDKTAALFAARGFDLSARSHTLDAALSAATGATDATGAPGASGATDATGAPAKPTPATGDH